MRKSEIQDGGFENSVAQISADTHDSNEIPTATPMFPGSDNTYRLYTGNTVPCLDMLEIKDGGHSPEIDRKLRIFQLVYTIATNYPQLNPCFRGQESWIGYTENTVPCLTVDTTMHYTLHD